MLHSWDNYVSSGKWTYRRFLTIKVVVMATLYVVDHHHHHHPMHLHHLHHHPIHLHHRHHHHHPMHLHHHHHHYQVSPRISEHPRFHEMWEIFEWVSLYALLCVQSQHPDDNWCRTGFFIYECTHDDRIVSSFAVVVSSTTMSWSHARYCDTNQVCNTLIFLLGGLLGGEYAYQYFSVRNIGIVGADRRKMMRWYDYWCDTLWRVVVHSIIDKNVSVDIIIIIIVAFWLLHELWLWLSMWYVIIIP